MISNVLDGGVKVVWVDAIVLLQESIDPWQIGSYNVEVCSDVVTEGADFVAIEVWSTIGHEGGRGYECL